MSEKELTLLLELSTPYRIRQWERGLERPQPKFIPRLATAVGIDPLGLLDVDPEDPPLAALRLAAGIGTKEMGAPGMSIMTYQRIEAAWPDVGVSDDVVAAIAAALVVQQQQVEAAIRRTYRDHAQNE